jgi:hypothetical protein
MDCFVLRGATAELQMMSTAGGGMSRLGELGEYKVAAAADDDGGSCSCCQWL